ncbi:MAG: glycosyltransferase [Solirubrobacteraceae bacterium]|nr:glycosyltransferase [Solirubrobacteraceae bacterium]
MTTPGAAPRLRVAMLLHKSVVHDSRVRREATALVAAGHDVTVVELAPVDPADDLGFARRSVLPPAWMRRRLPRPAYRSAFLLWFVRGVVAERPDVIHVHDAAMLLPGLVARRVTGAPVVYDTHELATSVPYRDRWWARFVAAIETVGIRRARATVTVSDGIADRLVDLYRLPERPTVVRNVTDLRVGPPAYDVRRRLGLPADARIVLHQGAPAVGRGCDALVRAVPRLPDDVTVLFLGDGTADVTDRLRAIAAADGVADRVRFLPAAPLGDLLGLTAQATVGASLLEDTCENHRLALPNKVFEYLAAGIPFVASDLPEMRRLATTVPSARLAAPGDPASIASAIHDALALPPTSAPQAPPTWTTERARLQGLYARLAATSVSSAAHASIDASGENDMRA